MSNRSLAEALDEAVDTENIRLPVYPAIARRLETQVATIETPAELKGLVEMDPALVCTLFRAANASFFKGLTPTSSLEEAITRLGMEQSLQVVSQACRDGAYAPGSKLLPRYIPVLWQHAISCALGSWWLANRCGYQGLAEQAYLAGLLHDAGKLLLITCLEKISSGDSFGIPLSDRIIHEILHTMHIEQGLNLIETWQLPEFFHRVIDSHHTPELDNQDITVALVKLANRGCRKIGLGLEQDRSLVLPTTAEAQFLGISEIALAEYEVMLEDRFFDGEQVMLESGPKHGIPQAWSR